MDIPGGVPERAALLGCRPVRSTVVGVVGGSQAGKTTLVNGLVGSLPDGATVLSFDEYYHDLSHLLSLIHI